MYFAPSWYASRNAGDAIGVGERFEAIIEGLYRAVLKPGGLALDCGAHVGRHTFPLAECVTSSGIVYAIEPLARLAASLREECASKNLGQIKIYEVAVAEKADIVGFVDVQASPAYSGLQLRDLPPGDMNIRMITVRATTIDRVLEEQPQTDSSPAFWKLDLEGGELHALKGARSSLRKFQPILAFENGREYAARPYGYAKEDWYGFFSEQGYDVLDLFGNPFTDALWTAPDIPWYCVAFPRRHSLAAQVPEWLRTISDRA